MWNDGPRSEVSLLSPARYVELLSQRRTRGVLAFVFLEMMFFFGAFSFVGAMMKARFDVSFTLIGLVLAGYGLGGLLYSAAVHWLLLHFGQRGCVLLGGALGGLFYLGVAVAPAWPLVLVCTVGLGFGFYTVHNTLQTKGTDMAPHARAAGMALFSMMWAGGQAAGVSLMSAGVFAFGYAPMIAACGIAFALLALALRRELDQL
jgi:predicted MFS family arabinose efflux permease